MAITTKQQRQQRRSLALQPIADGVPTTDAATQLSQTWGCSRRTSLRDIELAQGKLANALNSVELQHMDESAYLQWFNAIDQERQSLAQLLEQ